MKPFLTALQFLTVVPVRLAIAPKKQEIALSMLFFPVVGFILGTLVVLVYLGFNIFFPVWIAALAAVTLSAWLTGGLHLDGLADTADGLGSRALPERALEIMRDSRIGAMGAIALVLVLLWRTGLYAIMDSKYFIRVLPVTFASSRALLLLLLLIFPYPRIAGKASEYKKSISLSIVITALLLASASCWWLCGVKGLIAFAVSAFAVLLLGYVSNRRLGGVTGDILGASVEIAEIVFLSVMTATHGGIHVS